MPENEQVKDLQNLNPQIVDTEIGVRSLRKIKIYPLSLGDEMKLTALFMEALESVVASKAGEELSNVDLVNFVVKFITDNISSIITMITGEKETVVNNISNLQLVTIVEIVYAVNFESISKNVKSLFEKISKGLVSERQSQQFVNTMDTESNTSFTDLSKMEDSPQDK